MTWNTLKTALASAETALAEKKSQDTVDAKKILIVQLITLKATTVKKNINMSMQDLAGRNTGQQKGVQATETVHHQVRADKELDKGAFDVVTRATVNHGLHRGVIQCAATIEAENRLAFIGSHIGQRQIKLF